jgi:hypothetical protein
VGHRADLGGWHLQEDLEILRGEIYSKNMHFWGSILYAVKIEDCNRMKSRCSRCPFEGMWCMHDTDNFIRSRLC